MPREVRPARLCRQHRRRLLRRLRPGARGDCIGDGDRPHWRRSEHAHRPIRNHTARSRTAWFGAFGWGKPTYSSAHEYAADLTTRRRTDPGSVGTRHRSAAGVDGSAHRRRGQALLLGVSSAGRSIARRARPAARGASVRSAAHRSTSNRSYSRERSSAGSTRWSAAWPMVGWAGSTWPTTATSTIDGWY